MCPDFGDIHMTHLVHYTGKYLVFDDGAVIFNRSEYMEIEHFNSIIHDGQRRYICNTLHMFAKANFPDMLHHKSRSYRNEDLLNPVVLNFGEKLQDLDKDKLLHIDMFEYWWVNNRNLEQRAYVEECIKKHAIHRFENQVDDLSIPPPVDPDELGTLDLEDFSMELDMTDDDSIDNFFDGGSIPKAKKVKGEGTKQDTNINLTLF